MEVGLLILGILAYVAQGDAFHLVALAAHAFIGLWISWKLMSRQPLCSIFVMAYVGLYFPNPIAICSGWIPLEFGTQPNIFWESNSLLMIGLDLFLFAVLRLPIRREPISQMPPVVISSARATFCIHLVLILCGAAILALVGLISAMGVDIFDVSKSFRVLYGGQNKFYVTANYLLMTLPLATCLVAIRPLRRQFYPLAAIGVILILHFMIFRIRTLPVAITMAYGIGTVLKFFYVSLDGAPIPNRFPFAMRKLLILGIPSIVVMGLTIEYLRISYSLDDMRLDRDRLNYVMQSTFSGGDLGYAYFTRRAVEVFPDREPLLKGQSYYRIFLTPIPRSMWPGKPQSTQIIFAQAINSRATRIGLTNPPGIVGDLYINFGPLGLLGMLVFGFAFAQERYRGIFSLLFLAGSGIWLLHLVRGGFTNPVMSALFVAGLCYLFSRLLGPTTAEDQEDSQASYPDLYPTATNWNSG